MIRAIAALALLAPLAAASDDPLAGRTAGTAVRCIDGSATTGPDIVDRKTILYRRGATIYRTSIAGCPSLRPLTTMIVELYGTQICRKDRFRLLEAGSSIPSSYCFFGDFVPYTKVPAASLRARSD